MYYSAKWRYHYFLKPLLINLVKRVRLFFINETIRFLLADFFLSILRNKLAMNNCHDNACFRV